jgi:hypothetical protein
MSRASESGTREKMENGTNLTSRDKQVRYVLCWSRLA